MLLILIPGLETSSAASQISRTHHSLRVLLCAPNPHPRRHPMDWLPSRWPGTAMSSSFRRALPTTVQSLEGAKQERRLQGRAPPRHQGMWPGVGEISGRLTRRGSGQSARERAVRPGACVWPAAGKKRALGLQRGAQQALRPLEAQGITHLTLRPRPTIQPGLGDGLPVKLRDKDGVGGQGLGGDGQGRRGAEPED